MLVGCGGAPSNLHGSPRSLVLSLSQLPYPGFVAEKGRANNGVISNKAAAGGDRSVLRQYQNEQRESAYVATFIREVSPQEVVGPVVIGSSAVKYESAAGASGGFTLAKQQLDATGWTQVSTGSLGAEAVAFTESKALDQIQYQSFVIEWRQANVVNQVRIAGNAATLDLNYALTLARVQERREMAS